MKTKEYVELDGLQGRLRPGAKGVLRIAETLLERLGVFSNAWLRDAGWNRKAHVGNILEIDILKVPDRGRLASKALVLSSSSGFASTWFSRYLRNLHKSEG